MSIATHTRDLTIQSGQGPYEANFYDTVGETVASLVTLPKAVAIVDENVAALYAAELAPLRDAMPVRTVPALESEKTLAGIERTLEFLQQNAANRDTRLVAI